MRQILLAPVALTAFSIACIPGVEKEAPLKVPPLNHLA